MTELCIFIPLLQTRILAYRLFTKADLAHVQAAVDIRASNLDSATTSLHKDSKVCLAWLLDLCQLTAWRPLADTPCLIWLAAAVTTDSVVERQ